jgi:hypothetical protein
MLVTHGSLVAHSTGHTIHLQDGQMVGQEQPA